MKYIYTLFLFSLYLNSYSQTPTVTATGKLMVPRWMHESQILPNGKVLAFGGNNGDVLDLVGYSSAELYNPMTGTWSYTGSMQMVRQNFASVVLNNGNVMAIGGEDMDYNNTATCEIYNVLNGTWSLVTPMQQVRKMHEAILLRNGKVLVAGGGFDNSRCELYDPSSNSWSYTGRLNVVHGEGVSMVMLSDGRILLTGGTVSTGSNVGEIYDPQTESWTQITAKLNKNRNSHSSILLNDGRVLIVGSGTFSFQDQISTEIYYPQGNYFSTGNNMVTNVGHSEMAMLDNGNVLVYSIGDIFSPTDTKALQMYNASNGSWSSGAYNFVGANYYTIHRLNNGKVLIVGGSATTGNGANQYCALVGQSGYSNCLSPDLSLSVNGGSVCAGKDFSIVINNSESDVTYEAILPSGINASSTVNGGGNISLTIPNNYLSTGSNVFTIKVKKSGCVAYYLNDTAIVNVQQLALSQPTITTSGSVSLCPGSNVTLTSSAGNSYLWSNGSTTQSITINQSGIFSVRVLDANGCASPSSANITTIIYPATISAGYNENTCQGNAPYALTGYSPIGGIWSGTGVSADGTFNPAIAGPGTYTLTYSLCGKTSTKSITVTATPTVNDFTIKALKDSICPGSNTSIQVLNSSSAAYYQLRAGTTTIGTGSYGNGSTLQLPSAYPTTTTLYNVRGSYSNSCGIAEIIKEYTITAVAHPTAHVVVIADTICTASKMVFKIANSNPTYKYRIYNAFNTNLVFTKGNGDTLKLTGPLPEKNASGEYLTNSIQATNALGCSTVTVFNKQVIGYENKANFVKQPAYVVGEPVVLANTSTGDQFKWTFDASASIVNSQSKNPASYTYSSIGPKVIQLISTSRFGCSDTISKTTYVHNLQSAAAGKSCFLDTIRTIVNEGILDMHVDSHNNTYIAGYFYVPDVGNSSGGYACYLQKVDAKGNLVWQHKQAPYSYSAYYNYYHSYITGISTDANDNVYITGSYSNTYFTMAGLTSSTLSKPLPQTFVMKLNSSGVGQWIIHGMNDPSYYDRESGGTDILYVNDNHIYVSIYRGAKMKFPDGTNTTFDNELTILQLDKNGKFIKKFTTGQTLAAYPSPSMSLFNPDVAVYHTQKIATVSPKMMLSEDGKLFIAGKTQGNLTFGSTTLVPTILLSGNVFRPTGYIAKLDTASGWQHAFLTHTVNTYGSNFSGYFPIIVPKVAMDDQNNIYVTDSYTHFPGVESIANMPESQKAFITLSNNVVLGDSSGSFIGKYDQNGNLLWYNHNTLSYPVGLTYLKASNDVVAFGTFDNAYYGQSSQSYGSKAIRSSGGSDCFISSVGSNGDLKWMDKAGSTENDRAFMMATNSCNDLTLLGRFKRRGGIKTDSLIYSNNKLFLARYSPSANCSVVCNPTDTPLKVSIYSNSDYPANISPIPVTVKFTRNVTGFTQSDLIVTNGTISGFTGSGSTYTFNLTPSGNGVIVTAKILAGAATDGTLNNLASNIFTKGYDNTQPSITLGTSTNTKFNSSQFSVTFYISEPIIDFTASDIQLSNCTVVSFSGSGTNYSAILAPVNEGNVSVTVPQGVASDSAQNKNTVSNVLNFIYDKTKPTVVISTTAKTPTATSPIPITLTFSEQVFSFSASSIRITFSGATVSDLANPSGDLKTFTANINCTTSQTNYVEISTGSVSDLAGNTNLASNRLTFVYDIVKPTVSISSSSPSNTSVSPIPVTVTFSKNVFELTEGDFIVTNGAVTNLTGQGKTYTLQLVPTTSGAVSLQLPAGAVVDTVGNTNNASGTLTRTYDNDKPTVVVASVKPNPTNSSSIPVTFTFSENVTGFTVSDIVVTNGTLAGFAGSGKSYSVNVTPIIQGTVTIKVDAGAAQDVSLNGNPVSNIYVTKYDNISPTVTVTSTITGKTRDNVIPVTITLSEDLGGFDQSDIAVYDVTLANFTGSGLVYTVDLIPTKIGSVGIGVNGNAVVDAAGNGNYYASYSVTYQGDDYTKPTVVISTTSSSPTSNTKIPFTFTWSESVGGLSSSDFTITNGTISNINGYGTSYTADLTPTTGGLVTIQVKADAVTDNALNGSEESSVFSIFYDNIRPTVTITSTSSNPTADEVIPVTFTFSETINGFELSDFTVTNGSVTNLTGSGLVYTANLIPTSVGTVTLTLKLGGVYDVAGLPNLATSYTTEFNGIDKVNPILTITSTAASNTNLSSIPVTFTFSETVTDFTDADIQVTNGTLSGFTGSGKVYSAKITPIGQGTITVDVPTNVVMDGGLNGNNAASIGWVYDNIKPIPTITSTSPSPTSDLPIPLTITFSEDISTLLTLSAFTISNGTLSNFAGSGSVYTAILTPTNNGIVTVSLSASRVIDAASNMNTAASFSIIYNQVVVNQPSLNITTTNTGITNQLPIPFTFTFSENVTGFTVSDIQIINGTLSGFSGSGKVYTVMATPTYQGNVSITVPANVAQNSSSIGNTSFFYSIVFDNIRPTATITSTLSSPTTNAMIPVTITFTESVTGLALTDFTLTNGTLSNLSGSGSVYTATLTPTNGGTVQLTLNSLSVTDIANNTNPVSNYSITYNGAPVIQPTLAITSSVSGPTNQSSIPVTFTFSESVTGFTTTDIQVTNGTISGFSGSGSIYTAILTPSIQGSIEITVPAGVAQSGSLNGNLSSNYTIVYDNIKPSAKIASTSSDPTSDMIIPITITFTENVASFSLSNLMVNNGIVQNLSGSGSVYTAEIIPSVSGEVSVTLNSGGVFDLAGNTNFSSSFSIIFDKQVTGVTTSKWSQQVIYPNPTTGMVTFTNSVDLKEAELNVISPNGIILHSEKIIGTSSDLKFDFSHIPNGVYDIRIKSESTIINQMLIIQH